VSEQRPSQLEPLEPLDPPMVPFAVGGIVLWGLAGLALLPFRRELAAHGHGSWLSICLAGFVLGFVGLAFMIRHDAHRRRRRAAAEGRPAAVEDQP